MYQRNRVFFIQLSVLNQLEFNNIIHTNNLVAVVQVILGMKRMMHLIVSSKMGVGKGMENIFRSFRTCYKRAESIH